METLLSTYWLSPAGRYFGMSLLSWRLSRLVVLYCHTPASIRTGQVEREIQVEEVFAERGAVWDVVGGAGTNC